MLTLDDGLTALLGLRGRCGVLRTASVRLRDNPLGDPSVRRLPIYLPPGADGTRLPTVYFLPAYGATAGAVLAPKPWERCFFQRVDDLVAEGAIGPVVVVAVDAWTRLGGSQYTDSSGCGPYASALIEETIPAVDAALPTIPEARGRALLGKSSGGFGALHLAMEFPHAFAATAALSPDGYFPYSVVPAFAAARRALAKAGGVREFVDAFTAGEASGDEAREAIMVLAYAAAYAARPGAPYAFDLPFDPVTGAIDNAVFAEWQAFDPVIRAADPETLAGLRSLRGVYVDCGDRDEYGLDVAARLIAAALRAGEVRVRHEEYRGGHRGNAERYDTALRYLYACFA